jgi:hypothetical protein
MVTTVSMGTYHRWDPISLGDLVFGEKKWRVVMVLANSKLSSEDLNYSETAIRETSLVWDLWAERTIVTRLPFLRLEYRHRRPLEPEETLNLTKEEMIEMKSRLNEYLRDLNVFQPA